MDWVQPDYAVQQYRNQLRNLSQTGAVATYVEKFRSLNLLIDDLHPSEALDRFVEGLKPEIAMEVKKIGKELSLEQAFDVATKVGSVVEGNNSYSGFKNVKKTQYEKSNYIQFSNKQNYIPQQNIDLLKLFY